MIDFTNQMAMLQMAQDAQAIFTEYQRAYRYAKRAMELHEQKQTALEATLTTEQLALVNQGKDWAATQIAIAESNFWHFLGLPDPALTPEQPTGTI